MPGQQGSERRKATKLRCIRYNPEHDSLVVALAARTGLTVPEYIRCQSLQLPPPQTARRAPCVEAQALGHALGLMGKTGSNLHQLLKAARFGDQFAETEVRPVLAEIRDVCRAIMEALGREP